MKFIKQACLPYDLSIAILLPSKFILRKHFIVVRDIVMTLLCLVPVESDNYTHGHNIIYDMVLSTV